MRRYLFNLIASIIASISWPSYGNSLPDEPLVRLSEPSSAALAELLHDSLGLFQQHLRDAETGLYYDRISLSDATLGVPSEDVSAAATGMGLITLAVGHASGLLPEAEALAVQTISTLDNLRHQDAVPVWSKDGYILHWFKADGTLTPMSIADGYSTVDTAILILGAKLAARYFNGPELTSIVDQWSAEVNWEKAIADDASAAFFLNFDIEGNVATQVTALPFNEYVLLPCAAKSTSDVMNAIWQNSYAQPDLLPVAPYEGIPLLTDRPNHHLPHFIIQFAYFLCPDVAQHPRYQTFMEQAYRADRLWADGQHQGQLPLFGLGAGSSFVVQDSNRLVEDDYVYSVNSISANEAKMVSPAVMAGFAPVAPREVARDLLALLQSNTCTYQVDSLTVLWRCSLLDLKRKVEGIEAVDFATMVFGLATIYSERARQIFSSSPP